MDWRGSVALVTGASSGIGAAIAEKLGSEGLRVALVARRAERLHAVAERIHAAGGVALVLPADLSLETERARVLDDIRATWGPVEVLINNAGFGWYGYAWDMPWEQAAAMLQLNVVAVAHLTHLCLPEMLARRRGFILNVGSIVGDLGVQGTALYGATKAFIGDYSATLYRELRGTGVSLCTLKPGPVNSEFFDVADHAGGRVPGGQFAVSVERVTRRVWRLLRHPRRVGYVPGIFSLLPWVEPLFGWLLDWAGPLLLRYQARRTVDHSL